MKTVKIVSGTKYVRCSPNPLTIYFVSGQSCLLSCSESVHRDFDWLIFLDTSVLLEQHNTVVCMSVTSKSILKK